jgi:hypothetical protein
MNVTTIVMYAVLAVLVVLYTGRRRNRLNQED